MWVLYVPKYACMSSRGTQAFGSFQIKVGEGMTVLRLSQNPGPSSGVLFIIGLKSIGSVGLGLGFVGNPKFQRFYPLRFLLSRDFAFSGLDWVIVITIPGETILEDINANMIVRVPAFKKQVQAFLSRVFNVI